MRTNYLSNQLILKMRFKSKWQSFVVNYLVAGIVCCLLFQSNLNAEESKISEVENRYKNLKVLPQDISENELMPMMKGFTRALGVRCNNCHVVDTTGDRPQLDFVSDENKLKDVSRKMMNLVNMINYSNSDKLGIPEDKLLKVECATCHRGQLEPHLIADVLMETYTDDGVDSMLSKYEYLRENYYGSHTFDFTENVLLNLGTDIYGIGDTEGGMKILKYNLELFPKSSWNYATVSSIYAEQGDTTQAITFMESAVTHSPDVGWYKRQLKSLTGE